MKYEDKTKNELINIIQNLHSRLKRKNTELYGIMKKCQKMWL